MDATRRESDVDSSNTGRMEMSEEYTDYAEVSTCPDCGGMMEWCESCQVWSQSCCQEFGSCECS